MFLAWQSLSFKLIMEPLGISCLLVHQNVNAKLDSLTDFGACIFSDCGAINSSKDKDSTDL